MSAIEKRVTRKIRFDFARGRQMFIRDVRAARTLIYESGACDLAPMPPAMNSMVVSEGAALSDVLGWVAKVARGDTGKKQLDALHIDAHGSSNSIELGLDKVTLATVKTFALLKNTIRGAIVCHCCQVANEKNPVKFSLGHQIADYANCRVLAAAETQFVHTVDGAADYANFEGPVVEYRPGGTRKIHPNLNGSFDMATVIFRP